jgi:aminoglycoside phosphotransferase (APT) family kinase protein
VAEWDPDVEIDAPLVRGAPRRAIPGSRRRFRATSRKGLDNSVWAVEDTWAFRFPRRLAAVQLVDRELSVLPKVGPLLPVAIPTPAFIGTESDPFPRPFFGHRILDGVEPADARLTDLDRVPLGAGIARFLRVLHARETGDAVDAHSTLPLDPNRRADMAFRVSMARDSLNRLTDLAAESRNAAERILEDGELSHRARLERSSTATSMSDTFSSIRAS